MREIIECPNDTRELPAANDGLYRFLGGSPLTVAFRLILLSILVGVVLAAIGFDPWNIVNSIRLLFQRIWDLGFDAINGLWRYFLLGAVIVIPDLAAVANVPAPRADDSSARRPVSLNSVSKVTTAQVFAIAGPAMVANLTTPLIGIVSTIAIGRLGDATLLGGVAMASVIFDCLFWLFGFLRMSTRCLHGAVARRRRDRGTTPDPGARTYRRRP